jgi:hypothetical protein
MSKLREIMKFFLFDIGACRPFGGTGLGQLIYIYNNIK